MIEKIDTLCKRREDSFDVAKGIAIICVILGHLYVEDINRVIYSFHMPLFFLISGYFLSNKKPFFTFAKGKVKSLLIPYYFTSMCIILFSIIYSAIFGKAIVDNAIKWVGGMLYGAGSMSIHTLLPDDFPIFIGALWFLWALFWATLLVRFILDFIANRYMVFFLLVSIFFIACYTAKIIWLPIDIQAGMAASLFVYLGWLTRSKNILSKKLPIGVIIIIFVIALMSIKYFTVFNMVDCNFGNMFISIPGALSISYLIILFCKKIEHLKCGKIMCWYGANSIVVLSFHIIELDLVPWGSVIRVCKYFDINIYIIYITIIAIKILWVTLGVYFSRKSQFLYSIYFSR